MKRWYINILFVGMCLCMWAIPANAAKTIRIGIGHQSFCTDTYTGGIVVKGRKLLEKYLPKDGKYADVQYDIVWEDYTSGPPITNQMLAGKLDIGIMGDYPLLVNGARFQETKSLRSLLVAMTGYNLHGSGNAVVVPTSSHAYSFEDLKGKRVSVPFGSAAHGMLLKALIDRGLSQDYFTLINQAPPVGATSIQEKKIDAHADFCPWGELLEFRGWGRKILDGSDTKIPYLHGVVVRQDFAERYPEIVVAYLKAVIEAGEWVTQNPQEAAKAMQEWATINKEVMYLYFGPGGFLTLDTTMKPRWIETLKYNVTVLQKMEIIKQMDVDAWTNDTYLKQAYKETGRDYDQQLAVTSRATSPVSGTDPITGRPVADPRLAGEIWTTEDCILTYNSPVSLLVALRTLEQQGQGLQAAYAFDYASGLKLFANQAFYVLTAPGSSVPAPILPFATKQAAEAFAAQHGGQVVNLDEAKQAAAL